ncbi:T9SS type A sorting domain-containing protein [Nonlabens xiamenensis]|uniref:T9SS type A sorting domain-containing protein n=1 Tax=Nonlabens xiamenensis TaxID=2341043 RepID=UPI0013DE35DB|nr:T9SS type A sorting domain-containing protein [Nonlabens xiamenensis]
MKKTLLLAGLLVAAFAKAQCVDPVLTDFECSAPSHPLVGAITTVTNPSSTGINTSANVGQFVDDGTMAFDNLSADYVMPIDLSLNSVFHIKVYTSIAASLSNPIPLVAKLEGGTTPLELTAQIEASDEWREYTFDFSQVSSAGNTRLVLFFNAFQTNGTANDIYFIDDLFFDEPVTMQTMCADPILTDFECDLPSQPLTGAVTRTANPFPGGLNTSAMVGDYTDDPTDAFDNLAFSYSTPIDLSVNNKLRLKVYATQTAPLLVKLENGTSMPVELGSVGTNGDNIDTVNAWKEYEFDFSSQANENHQRLVLFFNAGNTQATAQTYFVDDIRWESTTLSSDDISVPQVNVYPNPAVDFLNLSSNQQFESYSIVDLSGRSIVNNAQIQNNLINIQSLSQGMFFLRLDGPSTSQLIRFYKK